MRRLAALLLISASVALPSQVTSAAPGGIVRLPTLQGFGETLSDNGRFIAFASDATSLVAGDTNGSTDVFVYDRSTGVIQRVSVATGGAQANAGSGEPSISANGRFVSFTSSATNLVSSDSNGFMDVFVRDRTGGTTLRVSVSTTEQQLDGDSNHSWINGNGALVVFHSTAPLLLPPTSQEVIVLRNRTGGSTEVVGGNDQDECLCSLADNPRITANGRYITWRRFKQGTSGDPEEFHLVVYDRTAGLKKHIVGECDPRLACDSNTSFDDYDVSDDANIVAWTTEVGVSIENFAASVITHLPGATVAVAADGSRVYAGGSVLRAFQPNSNRVEVLRVVAPDSGFDVNGANVGGAFVLVNTSAPNLVANDTTASPDDFLVTAGVAPPSPSTATGNDVIVQPDARVLVAATVENAQGGTDVEVLRYTAAGDLDSTFGIGGTVALDAGNDDTAAAIGLQANGRIVVITGRADISCCHTTLYRLTSTGALDTSFGIGGHVSVDVMRDGSDVLVDAQGRILVSGTGHVNDSYRCTVNESSSYGCDELVIERFLASGQPDQTFGNAGIFDLGSEESDHSGGPIAILGTGYVALASGFGVVAVTGAGTMDPTFGTGGIYPSSGETLTVVAGEPVFASGTTVTKLTSAGIPDAAFGGDGTIDAPMSVVDALGAAGNGRTYVGGWTYTSFGTPQFTLDRLTITGTFDATFSGDGKQTVVAAPGGWSQMRALRVMTDGRVVLVGSAVPASDQEMDLAVARLTFTGILDSTFGGGDGLVLTPHVVP